MRGGVKIDSTTVKYRAIWISDIHLGTRGCQADKLLDFLKKHDSEYLYLVGDIIDGWRLKRSWYWPQEHNDVVQKILRKARKGAKVIFVPGNHDEFAREYLGHRFGDVMRRRQIADLDPGRLDRTDMDILRHLQLDGRLSNIELSKRVNLSPTPCLNRVKRMERDGVITGYGAFVDPSKLDAAMLVFVEVVLNRTTEDVFAQFKEAVIQDYGRLLGFVIGPCGRDRQWHGVAQQMKARARYPASLNLAWGAVVALFRSHIVPLVQHSAQLVPPSPGLVKAWHEALAIARECRTLLGGSGITLEYSPLRHANNLESVLTYEGTSEMHLLSIGRALTGHAAFR